MCLWMLSIRLMSEVLYARVPSETKGAIDAFAGANGRSVAAAVAELLSRGLQATSQSSQVAELQERLQRKELALARKDVELHEAKLALESFVQREGERLPRRPGERPPAAPQAVATPGRTGVASFPFRPGDPRVRHRRHLPHGRGGSALRPAGCRSMAGRGPCHESLRARHRLIQSWEVADRIRRSGPDGAGAPPPRPR